MSVTIRQAGSEWLIEVQGEPVATACAEAEAQELAEQWTAKLKWRASLRFAPPWFDEHEYNRIVSEHSLQPTTNHLIACPSRRRALLTRKSSGSSQQAPARRRREFDPHHVRLQFSDA